MLTFLQWAISIAIPIILALVGWSWRQERRLADLETGHQVHEKWIGEIERRRDDQHAENKRRFGWQDEKLDKIDAKLDKLSDRLASTRSPTA